MNAVIKILSTQNYGSPHGNTLELVTDGEYEYAKDLVKIVYQESPVTGMEGTTTTLQITPQDVRLNREGNMTSSTVFREGQRCDFLYSSPYGTTVLGVETRRITRFFNEHGGHLGVDYIIDMDHAVVGRNSFQMNVSEREDA